MVLPEKSSHPKGDAQLSLKKREIADLVADTFDVKSISNGTRKYKQPR
jgi:hypothetical protein